MKVGIIYSPDPVYMNPFIMRLILENKERIACVIMTNGSILKKKSLMLKIDYFFSLWFILGTRRFFKNLFKVLSAHFSKNNKVKELCEQYSIPYYEVNTVNSEETKNHLKKHELDLVFNQSQHIVKKDVLTIPKFGMFNRHGAILPYYRGRLAPFWQLLNKEDFGGITYHFLNEKIDDGDIIIQTKIKIEKNDNFNSLVDKIFDNAVSLFPKVIDLVGDETSVYQENIKDKGSYFGSPRLKDAFKFRMQLMKKG